MSADGIEISEHASHLQVVLNRPASRNALTREMFDALLALFSEAASRTDISVISISGSGGSYCSGADLKDPMMGGHLPSSAKAGNCKVVLGGLMNKTIEAIYRCPVPVVSMVNGIAAGGGVGLALAADIVIATHSAKFVLPFTPRLAMVPDLGTTWQINRLAGPARALGIALLGQPIAASEAAAMGLIWQAVDDDVFEEQCVALVNQLAAGPRDAQIATKALLRQAAGNGLVAQLAAECDAQSRLTGSADAAEAIAAFTERRPPKFAR